MTSPPPARVRPATPADAHAIAAIYAPYVTDSVASFEEVPPDAGEMRRRMLVAPRLPWFLAERDGAPVGYCSSAPHHTRAAYRWSVNCSVYLADSERGRGTARALYGPLLDELRSLGYVTALAGVALPNDASIGFHESMGFRPVGVYRNAGFKLGAWHDVGWWHRPLRDPPAAPDEPRAWS